MDDIAPYQITKASHINHKGAISTPTIMVLYAHLDDVTSNIVQNCAQGTLGCLVDNEKAHRLN